MPFQYRHQADAHPKSQRHTGTKVADGVRWLTGIRLAVGLFGCAILGLPSPVQAAIGLTGWSSAGFSGVENNHGFEFSTTREIRITDLGFHDVQWNGDGLATSHEVGIWRVSDQTLMVSSTVAAGTAAPLDGEYRYVAVTPTLLAPGSYIVSAVTTSSDPHIWNFVAPIMSGPLTYLSGRIASPVESASLVYPNSGPTNNYAPANFKYDLDLVLLDAALVAAGSPALENVGGTLRIVEPEVTALAPGVFVVPEPGLLWQLGPGLALLGGLKRRRAHTGRGPRRDWNPRVPPDTSTGRHSG